MEQMTILGILAGIGGLSLCFNIVIMIIVISSYSKMNKKQAELCESLSMFQRQLSAEKKPKGLNKESLAELQSAVSSAVAAQMEYERKQASPVMMMPQMSAQQVAADTQYKEKKSGTILCRNCYKPYPASEPQCPFCHIKH